MACSFSFSSFESFVKSISYKTIPPGLPAHLWFESFVKSISYKTISEIWISETWFESLVKSISYKTNSAGSGT